MLAAPMYLRRVHIKNIRSISELTWELPTAAARHRRRRRHGGGPGAQPALYGNVLDAYGTGVFGDGVTRSERGQAMLERLAELNMQGLTGTLTATEREEQTGLRDILPTEASTTQTS